MMNGKENLEKIKVCIRVELTLLEKAKFVVHLKTIIEQISIKRYRFRFARKHSR